MGVVVFWGGGAVGGWGKAAPHRMADVLRQQQGITGQQLSVLAAANERLTRAQTELVSAARLATVGELAAGVAHEIGNPLAGILGYLSIARSKSAQTPQLR